MFIKYIQSNLCKGHIYSMIRTKLGLKTRAHSGYNVLNCSVTWSIQKLKLFQVGKSQPVPAAEFQAITGGQLLKPHLFSVPTSLYTVSCPHILSDHTDGSGVSAPDLVLRTALTYERQIAQSTQRIVKFVVILSAEAHNGKHSCVPRETQMELSVCYCRLWLHDYSTHGLPLLLTSRKHHCHSHRDH